MLYTMLLERITQQLQKTIFTSERTHIPQISLFPNPGVKNTNPLTLLPWLACVVFLIHSGAQMGCVVLEKYMGWVV